jgi:hypothetical protein
MQHDLSRYAKRAIIHAESAIGGGDVVTDEMEQAHRRVVGLAMNGSHAGLQ